MINLWPMEAQFKPDRQQPVSIHPSVSHPLMIATAVIVLPLLLCVLAGTFLLVSIQPGLNAEAPLDTDPNRDRMNRYEVANSLERQAICNDGTPATYYYRPGTDNHRDSWIIFLEGLEYCDSEDSCLDRHRRESHRTGSKNYPPSISPRGLVSAYPEDNPDFWEFNHVYVKYCSSDFWSGDSQQTLAGDLWQFRGDKIFTAVIEDLQTKAISAEHHLGLAQEVILAGSAAGGMGVSYQLDSLSEILPGAEVTGVIDSAWYPSELTDLDEEPAFDYPAMHTFWNSQVDATCGIDNPDEPWLCLPLPDSSEYLDTPVFISVDQSDEYLLDQLGLGQNPQTPEEILFVDTIRNSLRDSLAGLDGVFSPNQNLHTLLASEKFTSITILDQNYAQTLGNWYFSRPGNTKVIEE